MFEGSRLKQQRTALHLSQELLAEELDVHVNTIRRWEQGKQVPDINKLERLADALDTTVAYLSGETDAPQREYADEENMHSPAINSTNTIKNPSFIREGDFIGSGRVLMYEDKGKRYVFPATKENQAWFRELVKAAITGTPAVQT
ncbi:MAG: helix-turn-helix transcriptional regulator [Synergistaceae bacterium]|nr:helix-turn-helix transcriptional regulator [Synergistaceae bacterium]